MSKKDYHRILLEDRAAYIMLVKASPKEKPHLYIRYLAAARKTALGMAAMCPKDAAIYRYYIRLAFRLGEEISAVKQMQNIWRLSMKTSDEMINQIAAWEGLRLKAYLCPAGVWTIGYGHTAGVREGDKVTKDQAVSMLRADLIEFEGYVNKMFNGVTLTQRQFDAAVSFCFNVGPTKMRNKAEWVKLLKDGRVFAAADALKGYGKAQWKVAPGLEKRRKFESMLLTAKDNEWVHLGEAGQYTLEGMK